jgi:hypothetical protein
MNGEKKDIERAISQAESALEQAKAALKLGDIGGAEAAMHRAKAAYLVALMQRAG